MALVHENMYGAGNFTKVVQRIPVLIRLDAPPDVPFRPGMSAFASVATKD